MYTKKNIGTLLLEYGLIDDKALQEGLKYQKEKGLRLGEALVKLGKVNVEAIEWLLSEQLNIPFVIVEDVNLNIDLLSKFRRDFLVGNRVLPLYETDEKVSVVIEDPFNHDALDQIKGMFNKKVQVSVGNGDKIEELLKKRLSREILPRLAGSLRDIIDRLRHTSFYRIDFLVYEKKCEINVFGMGRLKNIATLKGSFKRQDIFNAFDNLEVPLLYDAAAQDRKIFLSVYPLAKGTVIREFPAIIGEFGLYHPEKASFSDAHTHGDSNFFSGRPVAGYTYMFTKKSGALLANAVYTTDSAPENFEECYVRARVPKNCGSCGGSGCGKCNGLGLEFKKIEGTFSSDQLKTELEAE